MDTLLMGGDHWLDSRGLPVEINGDAELIQRALIRLNVRRGSLEGDPALGSNLHKLGQKPPDILDRLARSYVQEALLPMQELRVEAVETRSTDRENLAVTVQVSRDGRAYQLEVEVA